jgi:hypothetical protein
MRRNIVVPSLRYLSPKSALKLRASILLMIVDYIHYGTLCNIYSCAGKMDVQGLFNAGFRVLYELAHLSRLRSEFCQEWDSRLSIFDCRFSIIRQPVPMLARANNPPRLNVITSDPLSLSLSLSLVWYNNGTLHNANQYGAMRYGRAHGHRERSHRQFSPQ